jgi:antitoxin component YwqK of YwqJK toxin-antitoxin module
MNVIGLLKKTLMVVLIIWVSFNGYSQEKHLIFLRQLESNKTKKKFEYEFVNKTDSTFVAIKQLEDFGIVYSMHYRLKEVLPDGEYQIFVNNELKQVSFIKDGRKNGEWIQYNDEKEKQIIPYSKGKINGKVVQYYSDGYLKRETVIKEDVIKVRRTFNKAGKIVLKECFRKNKSYKIKRYNEKGKLIERKIMK